MTIMNMRAYEIVSYMGYIIMELLERNARGNDLTEAWASVARELMKWGMFSINRGRA